MKAPHRPPKERPTKSHGGKTRNELRDGSPIKSHGHEHVCYHVHAKDTKTDNEYDYFEIIRKDDKKWIGRVSQYTRMDRVEALIDRRYEPETARITAPFTFGTSLRVGKKKKSEGFPNVWYVTIPDAYVQRFRIRVDDEVLVHIGDTEPDTSIDELYHVSMQGGTCIIVLSKIRKKAGEDPGPVYDFKPGEFRTVRIEASPSAGGRWNLFYFYDRIRSASRKDPDRWILTSKTWDTERREPLPGKDPDQIIIKPDTEKNEPLPEKDPNEDGPTTVFNDF